MSQNLNSGYVTNEVTTIASFETGTKLNESSGITSSIQEVRDVNDVDLEKGKDKDVKAEMTKTQVILVFVGLCFGLFLAALDQTIVATVVPKIAVDFKDLDRIAWIGTSYMLTVSAFLLTYGKLSDIFGRKITFLAAIIIFEIGSLLCGLSKSMTMIIISRAIAGVGGGGIIGNDWWMSKKKTSFGVASVLGPVLGGAFADNEKITWRWAFYINLPLGAITIIVSLLFLHLHQSTGSFREKLVRIDWLGTLVIAVSTVLILLALNWGGNEYAWNSSLIIALLVTGVTGFILFGFVESHFALEPLAPIRLFKYRTVSVSLFVNIFHGMAFFSILYFIPLFYEVVDEDNAINSGLKLLPFVIGVVFSIIFSGQLISRTSKIPYKGYCISSGILITVSIGLMSTLNESSNRGQQIGYLLIGGIGIGSIIQTTLLAGQEVVEYEDIASITSLLTFARMMGAVLGLSIIGSVFKNELSKNLDSARNEIVQLAPFLPPLTSSNLVNIIANFSSHLPQKVMVLIIEQFTKSLNTSFKVATSFGIMIFLFSLFMGNEKPGFKKREGEGDSAL
ncbi:16264_t:CDS:10, partial [Acaulospora morrowiae]